MRVDLTSPIFHDLDGARGWLEASLWSNGPVCPHCKATTVLRMEGKAHRAGCFRSRLGIADTERAIIAAHGMAGKRLTHRRPNWYA